MIAADSAPKGAHTPKPEPVHPDVRTAFSAWHKANPWRSSLTRSEAGSLGAATRKLNVTLKAYGFPDFASAALAIEAEDNWNRNASDADKLAAEAGTVASETGLSPRQLAEQRAELLAAAIALRNQLDSLARCTTKGQTGLPDPRTSPAYGHAIAAIARATGESK